MSHAEEVLEFPRIREMLLAGCETPYGMALAERLVPAFDRPTISQRIESTAEALLFLRTGRPPSLRAAKDYANALTRTEKGGDASGEDLAGIGLALTALRTMRSALLHLDDDDSPHLTTLARRLPELRPLEARLTDALESDGAVRDAASPTLQTIRSRKRAAAARVLEKIQSYVTGPSRSLLSDPIYTLRDGRYVIPLKAENRGKIKGIVHDTSATGHTIYLEPEPVLQLANALREVESIEREEERRILKTLSAEVGGSAASIAEGLLAAGEIDLLLAKARLGLTLDASVASLLPDGPARLEIRSGRHPLLTRDTAVPLDLALGEGDSILITGPNTGGKTVAMKTVGLAVLMTQAGLPFPASEIRLAPFAQIWADIGDEQSLQQSLSTFSGHLKNIAEALQAVRPGALLLFDEIGAGTDPAEGAALAIALLEAFHARGACLLASTHYGELKTFAASAPGFQNASMEFDVKSLRPTYRLRVGTPGASHALRIAERYGIPKEIVERAKEGLSSGHLDLAGALENLEQAQRQARRAQGEADRRLAELRHKESDAARKLAEAEEIRRTARERLASEVEAALRSLRLEATELFETLRSTDRNETKKREETREKLSSVQEKGSFLKQSLQNAVPERSANTPLAKGASVRIRSLGQTGTLLEEPTGKTVLVQVGPMRLTAKVGDLDPVASAPSLPKPRRNLGLEKAQSIRPELHLRRMRAEEAIEELERFLDDALLAGLSSLRIVHGKGEGVLRKVTREFLQKHPSVASFREGETGEGGSGVTIATLR